MNTLRWNDDGAGNYDALSTKPDGRYQIVNTGTRATLWWAAAGSTSTLVGVACAPRPASRWLVLVNMADRHARIMGGLD